MTREILVKPEDAGIARPSHLSRPIDWILWTLIALLALARIHLLLVRVYDPDEFEHIHAGTMVAQGLVPYRDFFEHHGPLTYWLSAGIVSLFGPTIELLTVHRVASLFFAVLTATGTWLIAKQVYGSRTGTWALLGMLTFPVFVEKSVEWRPDASATALVVWATLLVITPSLGTTSTRRAFLNSFMAGCLMAMALLTTQKTLFLVFGLFIAAILTWRSRGERLAPRMTGMFLGGVLVLAVVMGVLYQQHALEDAYLCLFERPLTWPTKTRGPDVLFGRNSWAPGHQAAAIVALMSLIVTGLTVGRHRGRKSKKTGEGASPHSYPLTHTLPHPRKGVVRSSPVTRRGRLAIVLPLITHGFGILLTPAIYFQFYMLAIPLLAVLIAGEWTRIWQVIRHSRYGSSLGWMLGTAMVAWFAAGVFLLPRGPVSLFSFDLAGVVILPVAVIIGFFRPRAGALVLGIALITPAVGRVVIPHFYWPNHLQREDIELVDRLVKPNEMVLDGFTGIGCLRPHVNYWWWINEHTIPMMRDRGDDAEIFSAVAQGKPAVVLFDENLRSLGGIEQLLGRQYVPLRFNERRPYFILLRRDLMSRWQQSSPAKPNGL